MQYGQLKKTGRCALRTEEAVFRLPHPGTGAYRLRAVSMTVQQMSMSQPLPVLPASPLNVFAGQDPEQTFTLSVSKAANPGVNFTRVTDVVLALEYEASYV